MKTITAIEAHQKLREALVHMTEQIEQAPLKKQQAIIGNIAFEEIFYLYGIMQTMGEKRQLIMPGELENESIIILYWPCEHCLIVLESEPCIDYRWKVRQLDFTNRLN